MIVAQLQEAGLRSSSRGCRWSKAASRTAPCRPPARWGVGSSSLRPATATGWNRSNWVDEHHGPGEVDQGGARLLAALHDLFGDWLTALAAYNCGEHNVLRQINNAKVSYLDQFWDLYSRLPGETRRYVPRFLATLAILENPARYGFELPAVYPAGALRDRGAGAGDSARDARQGARTRERDAGADEPGVAP